MFVKDTQALIIFPVEKKWRRFSFANIFSQPVLFRFTLSSRFVTP